MSVPEGSFFSSTVHRLQKHSPVAVIGPDPMQGSHDAQITKMSRVVLREKLVRKGKRKGEQLLAYVIYSIYSLGYRLNNNFPTGLLTPVCGFSQSVKWI